MDDAKDCDIEMRKARQLLGLPDCSTDSNIHICNKEISPGGIFLFAPPEKYQLYFLTKGTMDVFYRKETINIPEGKLFFLTGKESIHFKPHSECLLSIVCFHGLADRVNNGFFEELSIRGHYKIHCSFPLFTIPEKLKIFATGLCGNLSNKEIHPSTLELIFTFMRTSFTPINLAILFHEMIENMTHISDTDKSIDQVYPDNRF